MMVVACILGDVPGSNVARGVFLMGANFYINQLLRLRHASMLPSNLIRMNRFKHADSRYDLQLELIEWPIEFATGHHFLN